MKIGAQDKPNPSSYSKLVYAHARPRAPAFYVFTLSFSSRSIFGLLKLFLRLILKENASKERLYNHRTNHKLFTKENELTKTDL